MSTAVPNQLKTIKFVQTHDAYNTNLYMYLLFGTQYDVIDLFAAAAGQSILVSVLALAQSTLALAIQHTAAYIVQQHVV